MGIRGLTRYINDRAELYLHSFELHDTYVVIDGNSLVYTLYRKLENSNCCFGGDYDKLAKTVGEFFDSLAKCNVTPLVLMDGGTEERRISASSSRYGEKISAVFDYNKITMNHQKFFPLFIKEVFKEVMSEKGIKNMQNIFEGDYNVASTARILNCPVLSSDSDYFIYHVMYIPFDTLDFFKVESRNGKGYMKKCKIFRAENLLKKFRGLDRLHLPLVAILLGNDYVDPSKFQALFGINIYSQQRIETTFVWLRKRTFENAISDIISIVPQESRKQILEVIGMTFNMYTSCEPQILIYLGFSEAFVSEMKTKFKKEPLKFQWELKIDFGDLKNEIEDDPEFKYDKNFQKAAPAWFIQEFHMGRYAAYFIDILTRRTYVCPMQIEDYSYPAAVTICTKMISVIYGLLTKGLQSPKSLSFQYRGNHKNVIEQQLEAQEKMFGLDLPNLFNLRNLPMITRKKILEETLGIPDLALKTYPEEWKLYVATAIFWQSQQQEPSGTNCHLYSLLLMMLFNVVDKKIEYHRSEQYFHEKYSQNIQEILHNRRLLPLKQLNQNLTVNQAYCEITKDDCLLAAPFFLSNFGIDKRLVSYSKNFQISIVHAFAQFQICLWHSLNLNALLGFPYQQTRVSEMLNGTLLYNLYCNLKESSNIDAYVSDKLKISPSLLRLFNLLLNDVKGIILNKDVLEKINSLNLNL